jgi:hypothetical protein
MKEIEKMKEQDYLLLNDVSLNSMAIRTCLKRKRKSNLMNTKDLFMQLK